MHNTFTLLSSEVSEWAVLRTSARWEKQLATHLIAAGVPVFLPILTRKTTRDSRSSEALLPMFSGYVFASATEFVGNPAVPRNIRARVAQVIRPVDPEPLLRELQAIAELLTDRQLVQERVFGQPGETVRVVGGPLTGSVGKIIKLKPSKYAVVIEVSLIGTRIFAEVDESMLARE